MFTKTEDYYKLPTLPLPCFRVTSCYLYVLLVYIFLGSNTSVFKFEFSDSSVFPPVIFWFTLPDLAISGSIETGQGIKFVHTTPGADFIQ